MEDSFLHTLQLFWIPCHAIWPHQHPFILPEIHEHYLWRPSWCHPGHMPWWPPDLFHLACRPPRPCLIGFTLSAEARPLCEAGEVWVGTRRSGVPWVPLFCRWPPDGQGQDPSNSRLAGAPQCPRCAVIPWLCQLLLTLHHTILWYSRPTHLPSPKGYATVLWHPMQVCVQHPEISIHHCTCPLPLDSRCSTDNRNRCLRLCHFHHTFPLYIQWRTPPHCLPRLSNGLPVRISKNIPTLKTAY